MSSSSCLIIVCSLLFVSENVHNISSLREHLQCWRRRGRLVKNSISATHHNSPYTHTHSISVSRTPSQSSSSGHSLIWQGFLSKGEECRRSQVWHWARIPSRGTIFRCPGKNRGAFGSVIMTVFLDHIIGACLPCRRHHHLYTMPTTLITD